MADTAKVKCSNVLLIIDEKPAAFIALADKVRKESIEAVRELKAMGIRSVMLTGDREDATKTVAERKVES